MTQQPQALKLLGVLFCGAVALIAVCKILMLWLRGNNRPQCAANVSAPCKKSGSGNIRRGRYRPQNSKQRRHGANWNNTNINNAVFDTQRQRDRGLVVDLRRLAHFFDALDYACIGTFADRAA